MAPLLFAKAFNPEAKLPTDFEAFLLLSEVFPNGLIKWPKTVTTSPITELRTLNAIVRLLLTMLPNASMLPAFFASQAEILSTDLPTFSTILFRELVKPLLVKLSPTNALLTVANPLLTLSPKSLNKLSVWLSDTHLEMVPKIGFCALSIGSSMSPKSLGICALTVRCIPVIVFSILSAASPYLSLPNSVNTLSRSLPVIFPCRAMLRIPATVVCSCLASASSIIGK
ncbi:hypothetical protein IMAU10418_02667 [Lactiplantibacillus plantarum]|nr:hypothetical protein [Lactiplantibacillus plantarum]